MEHNNMRHRALCCGGVCMGTLLWRDRDAGGKKPDGKERVLCGAVVEVA